MWIASLALTTSEIVQAVILFIIVSALSFGVITLLVSYIRFQALSGDMPAPEGTPGLEPREAFELKVAARIAANQKGRRPFCILLVEPVPGRVEDGSAEDLVHSEQEELQPLLRRQLRSEDLVLPFHENLVGLILDVGPGSLLSVVERLSQVLRQHTHEQAGLIQACRMGAACWPDHADRMKGLIEVATDSLERAPGRGTQTYDLGPEIPADEDEDENDDMHDPETGLLLQHHVPRALQRFVAGFRRERSPVSVMAVDIDFRDRYRVHYKQEGVDSLQAQVAALLKAELRDDDLTGFYEQGIMIAAVGIPMVEALKVAGRIHDRVARSRIVVAGHTLKVTVSIGVTGYPEHDGHPERLLQGARQALSAAVHHGGGMVMRYDPDAHKSRSGERPVDSF